MAAPLEIACSNGNLSVASLFTWNVSKHLHFLKATGYTNYELFMANSILEAQLIVLSKQGDFEAAKRLIGSTHAAFVTKESGILQRLAMPTAEASIKRQRRIQSWTDKDLLAIIYPDALPKHALDNSEHYPTFIAQPQANVWDRCNIQTSAQEWGLFTQLGIAGYCLDAFHARAKSKSGRTMTRWQETWPILLRSGKVYEIHWACGRIDQKQANPQLMDVTTDEGKALASDSEAQLQRTELGDMIACVRENWVLPIGRSVRRVVPEIPAAFLKDEFGARAFETRHSYIVENLRALLS